MSIWPSSAVEGDANAVLTRGNGALDIDRDLIGRQRGRCCGPGLCRQGLWHTSGRLTQPGNSDSCGRVGVGTGRGVLGGILSRGLSGGLGGGPGLCCRLAGRSLNRVVLVALQCGRAGALAVLARGPGCEGRLLVPTVGNRRIQGLGGVAARVLRQPVLGAGFRSRGPRGGSFRTQATGRSRITGILIVRCGKGGLGVLWVGTARSTGGGHGVLGGMSQAVAARTVGRALRGVGGIANRGLAAGRRAVLTDAVAGHDSILANRGHAYSDLAGGIRQACPGILEPVLGSILSVRLTGFGGQSRDSGAATEGGIGLRDHAGGRDMNPGRTGFGAELTGGGRYGVAGSFRLRGGVRRYLGLRGSPRQRCGGGSPGAEHLGRGQGGRSSRRLGLNG